MIDRQARDAAAQLVRQFRDGKITNFQLEAGWPAGPTQDRALQAIETMLWRCYEDHREHALVGERSPDREIREDMDRYAAFLDSDLPYQWSRSNFIQTGGLGRLVPLSLWLLWPLDFLIRFSNSRHDAKLGREGDLSAWPFLKQADVPRRR